MTDTLKELLHKLDHIEDDLPPDEFDPAKVVGDVKDKVDAIKWRIDSWVAEADKIEDEWIKPLKSRQDSLRKKAESLKAYLHSQMSEHGYEKLPGHMFRAVLQKSSPAVEIPEEPGPTHMLAYPDYVVQNVSYRWNKDAVREALQNGLELSFARLRHSRHLRFFTAKKDDKK